jgi:hypothetical protein
LLPIRSTVAFVNPLKLSGTPKPKCAFLSATAKSAISLSAVFFAGATHNSLAFRGMAKIASAKTSKALPLLILMTPPHP